MFPVIAIIAFGAVLCSADLLVTPRVLCGETPANIYSCLGNPTIVPKETVKQCTNSGFTECQRLKCAFEKAGWMASDAPDRAKLRTHFERYAAAHPAWAPAVQRVKTDCLSGTLQAQGTELNCPAYDITHCALTRFIQNASPSQWSTAPECARPRQFAAGCPICPESCFAPAIPIGSCNACLLLPRSP